MNVQLLILSDIHTSVKEADSISDKILALEKLVEAKSLKVDYLFVLIAGDIAASGKEAEYRDFGACLEFFKDKVEQEHPELVIRFVLVPGNHDVNRTTHQDVVNILSKVNINDVSDAYKYLSKRQEEYFDFQSKICDYEQENRAYGEVCYTLKTGEKIIFNLYNSSCMLHENMRASEYVFPLEMINQEDSMTGNGLVISMIHHSLDFFSIGTQRELEKNIFSKSSLLITGHTHLGSTYVRKDRDAECEIVETQVFHDPTKEFVSGVVSIYLEFQSGDYVSACEYCYSYENRQYCSHEDEKKYRLSVKENNGGFVRSPEFKELLSSLPSVMTIDGVENVTAEDVFIYPNLSSVNSGLQKSKYVNGKSLLSGDSQNKGFLIFGEQKSGKTIFARRIVSDMWRKGKLPVYLDCAKYKNYDLMDFIESRFRAQYSQRVSDAYFSLPKEKLCVVIDNFNPQSRLADKYAKSIAHLKERVGVLFLFSETEYEINLSQNAELSKVVNSEFVTYRICELNRKGRHTLIQKWVDLIGPTKSDGSAFTNSDMLSCETAINSLFGESIVPKYPYYVSLFLQAIGKNIVQKPATGEIGTYGLLYQLVIQQQLAKIAQRYSLNTIVNYLSDFAYFLYERSKFRMAFSEMEYQEFCVKYNQDYMVNLRGIQILQSLMEIGVIIQSRGNEDEFAFSHSYFFYYFIANYLDSNIDDAKVVSEIQGLCGKFYDKHHANVWLFLTHISNKQLIVDCLLNYVNSLLVDVPEIRFDEDVAFLEKLRGGELAIEFKDNEYSTLQDTRYKYEDESEKISSEWTQSLEQEKVDEADPAIILLQVNRAVDAMGQLLRNFSETLKASPKMVLLGATYQLTFRTINFTLRLLHSVAEEFVDFLVAHDKKVVDEQTRKDAREKYASQMYDLMVVYAYLTMSKTAVAISHKSLQGTYEQVRSKLQPTNALTLIDALVNLTVNKKPESFIQDEKLDVLKDRKCCYEIIRIAIFMFCYMHVEDFSLKQKLCVQYGISYRNMLLASSKS